ncbi:ABC transporter ATP-binding protein [Acidianus manzaensis]|uniref:Dipeptide/oligopeptide/nickel ABC transporter ATP-binding protein n=1 Tax=Acidianus manzaensis TaxID=282676 RepID=A0A1W6JYT3_9CREN|nr:ABC transporter ATP-binding protein [Acidianus manzaensis]ARM75429.1 dipeptide/oligopeptide/nickel ABC transporter ATP-binding protein [Acidianus manzaensis]
MDELFRVVGLKKYFLGGKYGVFEKLFREKPVIVKALDGIDLEIYHNEVLGMVGESGSGKTTLGRVLATLENPTEGEIYFEGEKITQKNIDKIRKQVQMVFQNPSSSIDPRMRIFDIVAEPLRKVNETEKRERVKKVLEDVGLDYDYVSNKYPRELSGGQLQRIAIARAIITEPIFLVLDEPTSALDVSVQAQILNLLVKIQKEKELTYMFITHNINVARYISDRIGVLYAGKLTEIGNAEDIISSPKHPYTQSLINSIPSLTRRELNPPKGEVPSLINPPTGCRFHPRCPFAMDICSKKEPPLFDVNGRKVACWLLNQQ